MPLHLTIEHRKPWPSSRMAACQHVTQHFAQLTLAGINVPLWPQQAVVPRHMLQVVVFKLMSGELVFAFRGTEGDWGKGLPQDAITNALFFQTSLNTMRGMEGRFPPKAKVSSCCYVCCGSPAARSAGR
jgi:hypothetical protein